MEVQLSARLHSHCLRKTEYHPSKAPPKPNNNKNILEFREGDQEGYGKANGKPVISNWKNNACQLVSSMGQSPNCAINIDESTLR